MNVRSPRRRHHIFISHSWKHDSKYHGLKGLLDRDPFFNYSDYSVPRNDPIHNADNDSQLLAAIKNKMAPCSVILILAGVYSTYSRWINKEIRLARNGFLLPKPIVAIEHYGAQRTSTVVKSAADCTVKWRSKSIIDAIKELT